MMSKISAEELRLLLKFNNLTTSFTDEELNALVDLKIKEVSALTNLPLNDLVRKQITNRFQGNLIELDYYPVGEINNIIIDDTCLNSQDYRIDEDNGIIYLNNRHNGFLRVEYVHTISEKTNQLVNQLIGDMIVYQLTPGNNGNGEISSIHEMDTTVNYDTSTSQGKLIQSRIDELKLNNKSRVRWLW